MSENLAEQGIPDAVINRILTLESQMLELRTTPQPIGADALKIQKTPTYMFGPITLGAGSKSYFSISVEPLAHILTIWNMEFTIYVDNPGTAGFNWPGGVSLTSGQRNMRLSHWLDWSESYDPYGIRNYKTIVENLDSSSHDYYIRLLSISPNLPLA